MTDDWQESQRDEEVLQIRSRLRGRIAPGTGLTLQPGPRLSHNEAPFPNPRSARWRNPFPVLQRPRHDCLGVFRGQYRAVRVVEHFPRRRAKQEPAKAAIRRGHHDQIEFMFLCGFRNHIRRITAQKYAPGFCSGKLKFKKKLKLAERKTPVFPRDVGSRPCVKLESVMAAEIANVNAATSAPKIAAARLTKGTMAKQEDEKSTANSI